jgi:hypothetical protein
MPLRHKFWKNIDSEWLDTSLNDKYDCDCITNLDAIQWQKEQIDSKWFCIGDDKPIAMKNEKSNLPVVYYLLILNGKITTQGTFYYSIKKFMSLF